jgi:uncharacterized membrane protein
MPSHWLRNLPQWIAAAWWGSLSTVGFFVVPMLFAHLPSPAMAGTMAGHLFAAQTAVSTVCGMVLLLIFRSERLPELAQQARAATLFVVSGVLLALLVEFGVSPHIVARDNLALWHRVGSAMYFAQWVCASVVFAKLVHARTAQVSG